jgi:hypothetical protein
MNGRDFLKTGTAAAGIVATQDILRAAVAAKPNSGPSPSYKRVVQPRGMSHQMNNTSES